MITGHNPSPYNEYVKGMRRAKDDYEIFNMYPIYPQWDNRTNPQPVNLVSSPSAREFAYNIIYMDVICPSKKEMAQTYYNRYYEDIVRTVRYIITVFPTLSPEKLKEMEQVLLNPESQTRMRQIYNAEVSKFLTNANKVIKDDNIRKELSNQGLHFKKYPNEKDVDFRYRINFNKNKDESDVNYTNRLYRLYEEAKRNEKEAYDNGYNPPIFFYNDEKLFNQVYYTVYNHETTDSIYKLMTKVSKMTTRKPKVVKENMESSIQQLKLD